jgi:hypothetical protein
MTAMFLHTPEGTETHILFIYQCAALTSNNVGVHSNLGVRNFVHGANGLALQMSPVYLKT